MLMTFITKPSWSSVCLSKQPNISPQSFDGRFVNLQMCYVLSQSLVASISLLDFQSSRDPWVSRWFYKHILLPQNNNHQVKWKPWPTLQIWIAILSVSMLGCLNGHGSKKSFFGWPWFGSSGKSGSFLLPLVKILVLRKEEGAWRTECRTEWKFSPGIFSTDTVFYEEAPNFSFLFVGFLSISWKHFHFMLL